jgi:hypothetical protein
MKRWASMPLVRWRFQGITPASKGAKKLRRFLLPRSRRFGAPSAWLFLIRLLASRAGLRFTRHPKTSSPLLAVNRVSHNAGPTSGPASLFTKESHHE